MKKLEYYESKINCARKPFGISGFEDDIREYIASEFKRIGLSYKVDNIGNIIGHNPPKKSNLPKVMVSSHMDTCGMIVKGFTHTDHWSEACYVIFDEVGGFERTNMTSQVVEIKTEKGIINGVIADLSTHLIGDEESRTGTFSELSERLGQFVIDVGVYKKEDIDKLGIRVGDPCRWVGKTTKLVNNIICGEGMDNRLGVAALIELAEKAKSDKADLYFVGSVCEEADLSGCGCATVGINPDFVIGLDTTTSKEHILDEHDPAAYMGKGVVIMVSPFIDRKLVAMFEKHAKSKRIKIQREALAFPGGFESYEARIRQSGYKVAQIGIPVKHLHTTVETVSVNDFDTAINLLKYSLENFSLGGK